MATLFAVPLQCLSKLLNPKWLLPPCCCAVSDSGALQPGACSAMLCCIIHDAGIPQQHHVLRSWLWRLSPLTVIGLQSLPVPLTWWRPMQRRGREVTVWRPILWCVRDEGPAHGRPHDAAHCCLKARCIPEHMKRGGGGSLRKGGGWGEERGWGFINSDMNALPQFHSSH